MACTYVERLQENKTEGAKKSYERFRTQPHFAFRTQRGMLHWMVLSTARLEPSFQGSATEALMGEGWAFSKEEAWAEAVAVVGTDQMYLSPAGLIREVISDRAELRRQERMAAQKPSTQEAAKVRWLYSYRPCDYYRGADPFPYRRHRVLKETKQFLFVSSSYGEAINAKGDANPNAFRVTAEINSASSHRVRKSELLDGGRASMGSGWGRVSVWTDLDQLVELVRSRSAPQAQAQAGEWREVLGLPATDRLVLAQVKRAYRAALLVAHPDHGGSREQFEAVQTAFEQAKRLVEAG